MFNSILASRIPLRRILPPVTLCLALALMFVKPAVSQVSWTGNGGDDNFNNASNWAGGVPGPGVDVENLTSSGVLINTASPSDVVNSYLTDGSLFIENGESLEIQGNNLPDANLDNSNGFVLGTSSAGLYLYNGKLTFDSDEEITQGYLGLGSLQGGYYYSYAVGGTLSISGGTTLTLDQGVGFGGIDAYIEGGSGANLVNGTNIYLNREADGLDGISANSQYTINIGGDLTNESTGLIEGDTGDSVVSVTAQDLINNGQIGSAGDSYTLGGELTDNNSGTLTNNAGGVLFADSFGNSYFSAGTLDNLGVVQATNGGRLYISAGTYDNLGTVTANGSGFQEYDYSSSDSGVTIAGGPASGPAFTTAQMSGVTAENGGYINLAAEVDNTNAVLDVDAIINPAGSSSSGSFNLDGGTILNGDVAYASELGFTSGIGTLDGVTLDPLTTNGVTTPEGLNINGGDALIADSLTYGSGAQFTVTGNGTLEISDSASFIVENGGGFTNNQQTFDDASLELGTGQYNGSGTLLIDAGATVTLGPNLNVTGVNQQITANGTLTNNTALVADPSLNGYAPTSLTINGTGTFANTGSIAANNGGTVLLNPGSYTPGEVRTISANGSDLKGNASTVMFQGGELNGLDINGNAAAFTTSDLADVTATDGGVIDLQTTLDNTNSTLNVDAIANPNSLTGGQFNVNNGGIVLGGSITNSQDLGFVDVQGVGGTLDGVSIDSGLTVYGAATSYYNPSNYLNPGASVLIKDSFTYNSGAQFNITNGVLEIDPSATFTVDDAGILTPNGQTFDDATLNINNQVDPYGGNVAAGLLIDPQTTLTLGPNLNVQGSNAVITNNGALNNEADIVAEGGTNTTTIDDNGVAATTNSGTLQARNDGLLVYNSFGVGLVNAGAIEADSGGNVYLNGDVTNAFASGDTDTFMNNGTVTANAGGTVYLEPSTFVESTTNPGTIGYIAADGGGGVVTLRGGLAQPDSYGLPGAFLTSDLALTTAENGGSIDIETTLDNTGNTLDVDAIIDPTNLPDYSSAGQLNVDDGGEILNGNIVNSQDLGFTQGIGTLDGVTIDSDLNVNGGDAAIADAFNYTPGANFNITDGTLEITPSANLNGTLSNGVTTFDQANLNISNYYYYGSEPGLLVDAGANVVLGPNLVVGGPAITITDNGTLTNNTKLTADTQSGYLNLSGNGTFTNTGVVAATNGGGINIDPGTYSPNGLGVMYATGTDAYTNPSFLALGGGLANGAAAAFMTAELSGVYAANGGDLDIVTTLDNTGATLDVDQYGKDQGGFFNLNNGGEILNGSIVNSVDLGFQTGPGILSNVTIDGGLTVSGGDAQIVNSLTYNSGSTFSVSDEGTLEITPTTDLVVNNGGNTTDEGQTFADANLVINDSYDTHYDGLLIDHGASVTLDPTLNISGDGVVINNYGTLTLPTSTTLTNSGSSYYIIGGTGALVNNGTIASTGGGSFTLNPGTYSSLGTVNANGPSSTVVLAGGLNGPNDSIGISAAFETSQFSGVTAENGGAVSLQTTLDNTNNTLDVNQIVDPAGATSNGHFSVDNNGEIIGGNIVNSQDLEFKSGVGTLDNVTVDNGFTVDGGSATLVNNFTYGSGNEFTLNNGSLVFGPNVDLSITGVGTTPDNGTVFEDANVNEENENPYSGDGIQIDSGSDVELDPSDTFTGGIIVFGDNGTLDLPTDEVLDSESGQQYYIDGYGDFINGGIVEATDGGEFTIDPGEYSKLGNIEADGDNSTVILEDGEAYGPTNELDTEDLDDTEAEDGGTIDLDTTDNNSGSVLNIFLIIDPSGATTDGNFDLDNGGDIHDGDIVGSEDIGFTDGAGTLDGVTIDDGLNIDGGNARLASTDEAFSYEDGADFNLVNGTLEITPGTMFTIDGGTETDGDVLDNATIDEDDPSGGSGLQVDQGAEVTLGSNLIIIGPSINLSNSGDIINDTTISADGDTGGQPNTVNYNDVGDTTNNGTLEADNGGDFYYNGYSDNLDNTATIEAKDGGNFDYSGNFDEVFNSGAITADDGNVAVNSYNIDNEVGGTIRAEDGGTINLDDESEEFVNDGEIEADTGGKIIIFLGTDYYSAGYDPGDLGSITADGDGSEVDLQTNGTFSTDDFGLGTAESVRAVDGGTIDVQSLINNSAPGSVINIFLIISGAGYSDGNFDLDGGGDILGGDIENSDDIGFTSGIGILDSVTIDDGLDIDGGDAQLESSINPFTYEDGDTFDVEQGELEITPNTDFSVEGGDVTHEQELDDAHLVINNTSGGDGLFIDSGASLTLGPNVEFIGRNANVFDEGSLDNETTLSADDSLDGGSTHDTITNFGSLVNDGTMEAAHNGQLYIGDVNNGTFVNNSDGTLKADTGGYFEIDENGGGFTNDGEIEASGPSGSNPNLLIQGTGTFTNMGTVDAQTNPTTNDDSADITISTSTLYNGGVIEATAPTDAHGDYTLGGGYVYVDPGTYGSVGNVDAYGPSSTVALAGGLADGSSYAFSTSQLSGVNAADGGTIDLETTLNNQGSTLYVDSIANPNGPNGGGELDVIEGGEITGGNIVNSADLRFTDGNATIDSANLDSGLTINGGDVTLTSTVTYDSGSAYSVTGFGQLNVGEGATVGETGYASSSPTETYLNDGSLYFYNGTLSAPSDSTLELGPNLSVSGINAHFDGGNVVNDTTLNTYTPLTNGNGYSVTASNGSFTNNGSINVTDGTGGTFTVNGETINNGAVTVADPSGTKGGLLSIIGDYSQDAGTTTVYAGGILTANKVTINANPAAGGQSIVEGSGTIEASVENEGGTIKGGDSPGTLTIDGNYTQDAAGTTLEQLAGSQTPGTDFDVIKVDGAASLDGTLEIALLDGFTPTTDETFDFFDTSGGITGQYSSIVDDPSATGYTFGLETVGNSEVLTVESTPTTPAPESSTIVAFGLLLTAAFGYGMLRTRKQTS